MHFATDVRRAVRAEIYKLKHHSILVTVILLPLVIVGVMNLLLPLSQGRPFQMPGNAWLVTLMGLLQGWGFIQIFVVAVVTAQLAGLEHANNRWKYLFALPISRKAIYSAKAIVSIGLFGVSSLTILVTLIVTGLLLNLLKPGLGFDATIPWGDLFAVILLNYAASWLLIAIHTWAAHHWQNFAPAIGVAMVAFLLSMVLAGSPSFMRIYPWALPTNFFVRGFNLSGNLINRDVALTNVLLSLIGSIVLIGFSMWQITRRDGL